MNEQLYKSLFPKSHTYVCIGGGHVQIMHRHQGKVVDISAPKKIEETQSGLGSKNQCMHCVVSRMKHSIRLR